MINFSKLGQVSSDLKNVVVQVEEHLKNNKLNSKDEADKIASLGKTVCDSGIEIFAALGRYYYSAEIYDEAVKYFKIASSLGDGASTRNLGVCYTFGYGVSKSIYEAKSLLKMAVSQGDSTAKVMLEGSTYR